MLRRGGLPVVLAANKIDSPRDVALVARLLQPRARRAAGRLGGAGARHRRPARPARRAAARGRRARGGRGRRPPGGDRAPERRQVLARQHLPRPRAGDRLRRRGHDARRDRHADRGRRAQGAAGRHGRHPPRRQGLGVGRVLHVAALPARRRARRRRARGLRRDRRRDLAGPADRRHGHEGRLRDRARPQQVGPHERRRLRPRPRARAGQPQAAPAPEGADHLGADRPPRATRSSSRRCRWPTARATASRRRR